MHEIFHKNSSCDNAIDTLLNWMTHILQVAMNCLDNWTQLYEKIIDLSTHIVIAFRRTRRHFLLLSVVNTAAPTFTHFRANDNQTTSQMTVLTAELKCFAV